jgi:predicted secreted hydrolase
MKRDRCVDALRRLALSCMLLLCSACDDKPAQPQSYAGLGRDATGFLQVERGHALQFPRDHLPHDGYRIEWWYVTADLTDESGQQWGAQWTLFRSALRPGPEQAGWDSPNAWLAHAALTGSAGQQFAERRARGGIGQAGVQAQPDFKAWIDDWTLSSAAPAGSTQSSDALDHLVMHAAGPGFRYDLVLTAQGPLVLHGDHGYSEKSGQGQASYYYSQPFYQVRGEIEREGHRHLVTGQAWLDREWSSQPLAAGQRGWDWFSLHMDGGAKLMLFQVRQDRDGGGEAGSARAARAGGDAGETASGGRSADYRAGTWIDPDGRAQPLATQDILLEPLASTIQPGGASVPTSWRVRVPGHGLDITVQALQPQAWMATSFPYWEGPVAFTGSSTGRGYLEMTGY